MTQHRQRAIAYRFLFASVFFLTIMIAGAGNAYAAAKVDDWKFTPSPFSYSYSPGIQSSFTWPGPDYWYLYLIAALAIVLYLIPFVVFLDAVILFVHDFHDAAKRSKGTHRIALGLPLFGILMLLIGGIALVARGFYVSELEDNIDVAAVILMLFALCLIAPLLIRGISVWVRFRKTDQAQKKRGRMKVLFALLQILLLAPPPLLAYILSTAQTSSAISSPLQTSSYQFQSTGTAGGASQYFGSAAPSSGVGQYFGSSADTSIGLSVGGAKDINNFRENIKNGYLPLPTDVTYEGLFYDYTFDTGIQEPCQKLFCPSYATAVARDPFSKQDEYFLSVGLNSGIQQNDFARKKMNLLVVLDISGSMETPFDAYYYDRFGGRKALDDEDKSDGEKTKMQIASESVVALLDHLNDDDRFGMVLFDDVSYLAKPLRNIDQTDVSRIKDHIRELQPQGGTNMSAGLDEALKQFKEYATTSSSEYENRVIFLTDAMPNTGYTGGDDLAGYAKKLADKKIYTTFIGIGVDFNTGLVEDILKVRGANYYSVHSSKEFKERMDKGFDFMVTPLVFNLNLTLSAPGYAIEKVYGSPEADEKTGEIMRVNTLFPSERTEGETRGGLVLLQLKKISSDPKISLSARYEDRDGNKETVSASIAFKDQTYFENSGIRKGIMLARYANVLRDWMFFERASGDESERKEQRPKTPMEYYGREGIPVVSPEFVLGRWERQSMQLRISPAYTKLFSELALYVKDEKAALGDDTLQKELDVIELLTAVKNK